MTEVATTTELNARFVLLVQQRNNAENQNVIDAGTIAVLRERITELEARVAELEPKAAAEAPQPEEAHTG